MNKLKSKTYIIILLFDRIRESRTRIRSRTRYYIAVKSMFRDVIRWSQTVEIAKDNDRTTAEKSFRHNVFFFLSAQEYNFFDVIRDDFFFFIYIRVQFINTKLEND